MLLSELCVSGIRTSPEFQKLLGIAMEMFLLCSDDSESDVRMVADECLNKIIKVSGTPPSRLYHVQRKCKYYTVCTFCIELCPY